MRSDIRKMARDALSHIGDIEADVEDVSDFSSRVRRLMDENGNDVTEFFDSYSAFKQAALRTLRDTLKSADDLRKVLREIGSDL